MKESDSDTIIMVIVLVAGAGGVFILFALMALCYRLENNRNVVKTIKLRDN